MLARASVDKGMASVGNGTRHSPRLLSIQANYFEEPNLILEG